MEFSFLETLIFLICASKIYTDTPHMNKIHVVMNLMKLSKL